ncbi:MAG: hypothetical protein ACR2PA_15330 [Hyphomicrobiaceae bacterium]
MDGLGEWPIFDSDESIETAWDLLTEAGLSDGLPPVPPTKDRLEAMLDGVSDPAIGQGLLPPLFGELTNAAVAYNCVLAGCGPGALPVVRTAARACADDCFNLLGLATTTGSPAVAAVVHGPIAETLGMNSDINCLGPGSRANATLGRAISLVLRNIAGMRAGTGDMATMGQPGKYGFCFAEGQDQTFAPFHVRRGLQAGDSAVTVLGVSGTAEVLPSVETENWDTPGVILDPVALAMRAALVAGGGARKSDRGEQVLLLPPELASLIAKRDWGIKEIQAHLFESSDVVNSGPIAASPRDIHIIITGGLGTKMTVLPLWGGGTRAITRKVIAP